MPKRNRSRFEAIPQMYNPGYNPDDDRTNRRVARNWRFGYNLIVDGFSFQTAYELFELHMIRAFGFVDSSQRAIFAAYTGRLAYLQRAFREVIDRRRRQAYLLLRRVLPMELAGPVVLN